MNVDAAIFLASDKLLRNFQDIFVQQISLRFAFWPQIFNIIDNIVCLLQESVRNSSAVEPLVIWFCQTFNPTFERIQLLFLPLTIFSTEFKHFFFFQCDGKLEVQFGYFSSFVSSVQLLAIALMYLM